MDGDTLRPEGYKVEEAGIDVDLGVDGVGYTVLADEGLLGTIHRFTIDEATDGILGDARRTCPTAVKLSLTELPSDGEVFLSCVSCTGCCGTSP